MKALSIAFTLTLFFLCFSSGYSQLTVDAGADTAFCASDWENAVLGGNPTASGGTEPYEYAWSTSLEYAGRILSASDLLTDTTVANPAFKESFNNHLLVFTVSVSDANQDVLTDTMTFQFSQFVVCLGECREEISEGDSVKLGHCITQGILPYTFAWSPQETLSDPSVEDPWAKPADDITYTLTLTDSIGCQTSSTCKIFVRPANIENSASNPMVMIFPNPAREMITFQIDNLEIKNTTLQIVSAKGKLLLETEVWDSEITLDLRSVPSGLCLYKLVSEGNPPVSGKIVIE